MWLRYIRWLDAQQGMQDAVRLVFQRACSVFVPIARPGIRVQYAYWEERLGDVPMARAILAAVLEKGEFAISISLFFPDSVYVAYRAQFPFPSKS